MTNEQSTEPHSPLGALLRRYRETAGLSQEALAERAGISSRGLLYLERGRHRPYPATLRRLADALALTPQEREALALATRRPGAPRPLPTTRSTRRAPLRPQRRPRSHRRLRGTTSPRPSPVLWAASAPRPACRSCSRPTASSPWSAPAAWGKPGSPWQSPRAASTATPTGPGWWSWPRWPTPDSCR